MQFQFESLADFLHMAGHGPYVWAAYGIGFVVLGWLALRPVLERRQVLRQIAREQRRQQQRGQSAQAEH